MLDEIRCHDHAARAVDVVVLRLERQLESSGE